MDKPIEIRNATTVDAAAVARLHANSWRRFYRGAYSDAFLDGDVENERALVWTERLASADDGTLTLVAEQGNTVVGFVHVELDADAVWGALIDNLHVTDQLRGVGIGTGLLDAAAQAIHERRPAAGIYLWVQEQNRAAQAFYKSRGGRCEERELISPPGGDPRNLAGTPYKIRVSWPSAAALSRTARSTGPVGQKREQ